MTKIPNYAIGIDLGGTQIKAVAVTAGGKVLAEVNAPTEDTRQAAWTGNVRRTAARIQQSLGRPAAWVGLCAPGLPSKRGDAIAYMPGRLPGLEGLRWDKFLKLTQAVPVLNDAQAALLGEIWLGAAKRSRDVVLLTLGTGVGGAAMVDGHLLRGHIRRAGHLGHLSLNPAGAADITGTPGSLEDAIGDCTIKPRSGGRFASTAELLAASRRGDIAAQETWLASVQALAAAISSFINVLDPELVVIGGGIAKSGADLFRPLAKFLDQFEWRPGGAKVRIVAAKLGDRAGAFGAAWNAMQNAKNGYD